MQRKLLSHYKRGSETEYIIAVNIERLEEFYDTLDPSYLYEKDLNPNLARYLTERIVVFPEKTDVKIEFHVPSEFKEKNYAADMTQAFRKHFEFEYLNSMVHKNKRIKKGLKTFFYAGIIFMSLMTLSILIKSVGRDNVILKLISEGLFIGGWVSLWKPIEILIYDWLPLYEDERKYKRLRDIKVKIKYKR